jgi:SAM-dependent methyltransferase
MLAQIEHLSTEDLVYFDDELNRTIGEANGDFMHLDYKGPTLTAIEIARAQGHVSILDGGCGSARELIDLKDQIIVRAPISANSVDAVGVSLTDFSHRFTGGWREAAHLTDGYISLFIGNLATLPLEPDHFDVAYSYQVLLHNKEPIPIIENVLPSLSTSGIYYFDALVDQQDDITAYTDSLDPSKWQAQSIPLTVEFIGGKDTRMMNRIIRAPFPLANIL